MIPIHSNKLTSTTQWKFSNQLGKEYFPKNVRQANFYRSSHWRCSIKKVFLKTSQNSQESTCARFCAWVRHWNFRPVTLLKKRLWHRYFPVNFETFLRIPFLQNTFGRLFLFLELLSTYCRIYKALT